MPPSARITFRLTKALEALVSDRVRQGAPVSDIVREALEQYFGVRQTDVRQTRLCCQTEHSPCPTRCLMWCLPCLPPCLTCGWSCPTSGTGWSTLRPVWIRSLLV